MTTITARKVAFIHYTLTNSSGETIDSSRDGEPLAYLHGFENIVPGLERALEGKAVGDRIDVVVPPEEGYGDLSDREPQPLPLEAFEGVVPEVGMPIVAQDESGNQVQLWIVAVTDKEVLLSGDHPLAGVTLHFDVEIMEVRDATASELEQGQVHPR